MSARVQGWHNVALSSGVSNWRHLLALRRQTNYWGTLVRLGRPDCHYGFPFRWITND
jgi:hypothetical protein